MAASRLLVLILVTLFLVAEISDAVGDEIEWARFDLINVPPRKGHLTRSMTARVTQPGFGNGGPSLSIDLWQGECLMNVGLTPDLSGPPVVKADTVSIESDNVTHRIFPVTGGLEWEIILYWKVKYTQMYIRMILYTRG